MPATSIRGMNVVKNKAIRCSGLPCGVEFNKTDATYLRMSTAALYRGAQPLSIGFKPMGWMRWVSLCCDILSSSP